MGKCEILLLLVALLSCITGWGMFHEGMKYPVYNKGFCVSELNIKLGNEGRDTRRWYKELAKHETPHKQLTDVGRGLISVGGGLVCGVLFLMLAQKASSFCLRHLGIYWLFLWGAMIPLDMYYYRLTFERMDHPYWADSLGVPFMTTIMAGFFGYLVTFGILRMLLKERVLSRGITCLTFRRREQARSIFLWCWVLLLLYSGAEAIIYGIMGTGFSCIAAIPVLLLVISSAKNATSVDLQVPASLDSGSADTEITIAKPHGASQDRAASLI